MVDKHGIKIPEQVGHLDLSYSKFIGEQHIYIRPLPLKENLPARWHLRVGTNNFTGRNKLIKEMEKALDPKTNSQNIVITSCFGLGGVGKTQLALGYANAHYKEYKGVCFFNAEDEKTLIQEYVNLGDELNLFSGKENLPVEKRADIVKTWLEDSKRAGWLLIYDNAPKHKEIAKLLPTIGGKILITSRHTEWSGCHAIQVNLFTLEEARDYVKKVTGQNDTENIEKLIKLLGRLPLALAQACAYIKGSGISVKEYLELYEPVKQELLAKDILSLNDEHVPVLVTWEITLRRMQSDCPDSVDLMYSSVFFYNENIPQIILEYLFKAEKAALLKYKCIETKIAAKQYSMIEVDEEKKCFSMHVMVQEVIKMQLQKSNKVEEYLQRSAAALLKIYPRHNKHEHISLKKELLPHLQEILKNWDSFFEKSKITLQQNKQLEELLTCLGNIHSIFGNYEQGIVILERLLSENNNHQRSHDEINSIKRLLSQAYIKLGKQEKGGQLASEVLESEEKSGVISDFSRGLTYNLLGNATGNKKFYSKAKKSKQNRTDIRRSHWNETMTKTSEIMLAKAQRDEAITCGNLGGKQNQEKKKKLLQEALPIIKEYYGDTHYQVAKTLINLGDAYGALGDNAKKKEFIEKALPAIENHYGDNHYEVAKTLMSLGDAYGALGDNVKKKELLEEVLPIFKRYYGDKYFKIAKLLVRLANLYGTLGDNTKKEELIKEAQNLGFETEIVANPNDELITLDEDKRSLRSISRRHST